MFPSSEKESSSDQTQLTTVDDLKQLLPAVFQGDIETLIALTTVISDSMVATATKLIMDHFYLPSPSCLDLRPESLYLNPQTVNYHQEIQKNATKIHIINQKQENLIYMPKALVTIDKSYYILKFNGECLLYTTLDQQPKITPFRDGQYDDLGALFNIGYFFRKGRSLYLTKHLSSKAPLEPLQLADDVKKRLNIRFDDQEHCVLFFLLQNGQIQECHYQKKSKICSLSIPGLFGKQFINIWTNRLGNAMVALDSTQQLFFWDTHLTGVALLHNPAHPKGLYPEDLSVILLHNNRLLLSSKQGNFTHLAIKEDGQWLITETVKIYNLGTRTVMNEDLNQFHLYLARDALASHRSQWSINKDASIKLMCVPKEKPFQLFLLKVTNSRLRRNIETNEISIQAWIIPADPKEHQALLTKYTELILYDKPLSPILAAVKKQLPDPETINASYTTSI